VCQALWEAIVWASVPQALLKAFHELDNDFLQLGGQILKTSKGWGIGISQPFDI